MVSQLTRHKFTVDEYHKMGEAGIFSEDDRVELLDGEIVEMTPIGWEHATCVDALNQPLVIGARGRAVVRVQGPVRLNSGSEPQPDLALLVPPVGRYRERHPGPRDILLLIEVADSSVTFDRQVKIALYARVGIPEVWLVDLVAKRIELYRDPSPEGYKAIRHATRGDTVFPLAFPDLVIKVEEVMA